MLAWRTCKTRYDPYDGSGAAHWGGRWNSPGHPVLYTADSFAGSILEIIAHALRPRTLPGPHHAVRVEIPDDMIEWLEGDRLDGWDARDAAEARAFGDRWLRESRSAALAVPSLPARPVGRLLLLNLAHGDARRLERGAPFAVPWDEQLF